MQLGQILCEREGEDGNSFVAAIFTVFYTHLLLMPLPLLPLVKSNFDKNMQSF